MFSLLRPCVVALLILPCFAVAADDAGVPGTADVLTLADVEQLAVAHDVRVSRAEANSEALRERAVADGQLPDPKLTLGVMSLPVDSFDRGQEPMTQLAVGVSQAFPPGASRRYQAERTERLADAAGVEVELNRLELVRDARVAFLEFYYQSQALTVLADSRARFAQMVETSTSLYSVGRNKLQDVLRAELEASLLDDRETKLRAEQAAARAALEQLTGPFADQALPLFPELAVPAPWSQLQEGLAEHPRIAAAGARVAAGQAAVQVAREQYKPGWMLGVTYGDRTGDDANGNERPDFLTAMVTIDVPLFTGKRQDRRLSASIQEADAMRLERDDRLYSLKRELNAEYPRWQRLGERLQLFESAVLPQAQQNAEAALNGYRNGVTDFTTLMRAYLTQLDSELQAERVRVDRAQSQAKLLYLAGEPQ